MASKTEVCNLALSHVGVGKEISDIESDRSNEGLVCRRFYDITQDKALRDFDWPFARVYATLGLIEADPNDEWAFSYRYPSDCLKLLKILSGIRNDTRQSRVPYSLARDTAGRLIYTDMEVAQIKYTVRVADPNQCPPDFVMAQSLLLASYIAPRMTGGDPFKMGARAMQMYLEEMDNAKANSANEEQSEEEPESEFSRERD